MFKGLAIFILTFFLTISIFIYKPYKLYAQEELPNNSTNADNLIEKLKQSENVNCFIGEKCCVFEAYDIHIPNYSENISFPLNEIVSLGKKVGDFFLDVTINPISKAFFSFFRKILGINETYCLTGKPSSNNKDDCFCTGRNDLLSMFCANIEDLDERKKCENCVNIGLSRTGDDEKKIGVWTAIGCVTGDLNTFIKEKVFGFGIGLAGVVALFCIIYAAFQLQTSQGSPEKIKKAQELLTSCIMGLMLIIFSVFILKLIGVDILKIPSFR